MQEQRSGFTLVDRRAAQRGFTLVELSIVLVILALLVGSIVVGQSLVRSSEVQSAITDVNRYKTAMKMFQDKYHDFPGNKPNATTSWGSDSGCTSPANNDAPKTATCNGSGNGMIGGGDGTPITIGSNSHESLHAWQHLADAGFIDSQYNGANSAITGGYNGGINVPTTRLNKSMFSLSYAGTTGINGVTGALAGAFGATYGHILVLGTGIATGRPADSGNISADDAANIDTKIDDGQPGTGKVLSYTTNAMSPTASCATSEMEDSAVYNVGVNGQLCSLIFITGM